MAELASGKIEGVPNDPDLNWDTDGNLLIPHGSEWLTLNERESWIKLELRQQTDRPIPTAAGDESGSERELTAAIEGLADLRSIHHEVMGSLNSERTQLRATVRQLNSIEEDLQRHKDATKILSIGGELGFLLAPSGARHVTKTSAIHFSP